MFRISKGPTANAIHLVVLTPLPMVQNLFRIGNSVNQNIPQKERTIIQDWEMRQNLDKTLAAFLRKQRGQTPYAVFAKKLGITPSSLFRLENGEQSATLRTVQQISERLGVSIGDIFGQ
jgi:DNA-binding XRE family transcriptional regulator